MTDRILVTGGCGFIGSCFVLQQMQQYPDIHLINLDALTHAGNPDNVKDVVSDSHYNFVQANVADRPGHDRRYSLATQEWQVCTEWRPMFVCRDAMRETVRGAQDG